MPPDLRSTLDRRLAAALFAVLILAAALLFGAVDRVVQIGLVFGLGLGFLLYPPELPQLPRVWAWLTIGLIGFVILSQFLPYHWFGQTVWRTVLKRDYDVDFPFTRNPEPGRALDCILMGLLAGAWFFWVRTLACERSLRLFLVWALFATAAAVAIVSMAVGARPSGDYMIYGIRYTPGWTGFGPFPNRNHTAALLAMGALAGAGCLIRAARRRYWLQLVLAIVLEVAVVVALLETKSRGGLLGLGCGAILFAVLAISKHRSRSSIAGALAGGLLCATLVFSFGSKVLSRFDTPDAGNVPNNIRWQIWQDAVHIWRDAPLWGHGLGAFTQIYPLYQTVEAHDQLILHPESSWLLWLDELGAIPVAAGLACLLYFLTRNAVAAIQTGDRGFFIRAGAFAGVFALLCHSLWDVPAHRWGTAAFAIALLAIACPPLQRRMQIRLGRSWALAPIFVGIFWLLPFITNGPAWTPEGLRQLLAKLNDSPTFVSLDFLRGVELSFPLNPALHEQLGVRELMDANRPDQAWREFRIADRLNSSSWAMPAVQGWLSRDISPGMSFHFWSLSVERAGRRASEIFTAAYRNCVDLPGGEEFWRSYADAHPEFLLGYAENVTNDEKARAAYDQWWKVRGRTGADLETWEYPAFYDCLRKWGDRAQLEIWMNRHPELEASDYWTWASIFHQWQMDADAWAVLTRRIKDPPYPDSENSQSADALEADWRTHPDDPVSAQAYASRCYLDGKPDKSEQIILSIATGKSPPLWFIEKAAFLYAAKKDYSTAVTALLRLDSTNS